MSSTSNILKRKNEESESSPTDQLNKRVALDSEQLDYTDRQEDEAQTAPVISDSTSIEPPIDTKTEEEPIPAQPFTSGESEEQQGENGDAKPAVSKPVSNHRERDDPTYVSFRMYCPVKEASTIVGKKGEKINHIREKANVRINVSENLKNVPDRIVSVRGPAENVARAFGLISKTILEEPEDEPASFSSKQFNLKLLVPHPLVGYIIGKQGVKFREIEENSAAKLKAAEQPLPYSTDRILSISGVGDAIHIAIYYISQVVLEHKDCLKKNKIIYYNPANYRQPNMNNPLMNMPMGQNNMMVMGGGTGAPNTNPLTMQNVMKDNQANPYNQQVAKPYNFQMMFQPSIHPQQQHYGMQMAPNPHGMALPPQYTDEHGNNMVGDVITNPPVPVPGNADKYNEDVFVANVNIGSVIGKGGNNIKQIRENSGCNYVKIEPDQHQSIMLGGGKGSTNVRKLTLTGSMSSIQNAIYLINQRINSDKGRNN